MAREQSPAFQCYPKDFLSDENVQAMNTEQIGAYWLLCLSCWLHETIPGDLQKLARICRVSKGRMASRLWPGIEPCFVKQEDGTYRHKRLDREREKQAKFRRRASDGGAAKAEKMRLRLASEAEIKQTVSTACDVPNAALLSPISIQTAKEQQSGAASKAPAPEPLRAETAQEKAPLPATAGKIPSSTPSAPNPAKEFLAWFQAEYKRRRNGATYFVSWDKHMPIVGRLLKLHAPDRLRKHAQLLLTTDEPWTETTDRGIEVLAGKINWLDERLCRWEAERKARQPV